MAPRGVDGGETATGVIFPERSEKVHVGLRWVNMVITLIRGCQSTDLTMFPSGSSIRSGVSSKGREIQGCEVPRLV